MMDATGAQRSHVPKSLAPRTGLRCTLTCTIAHVSSLLMKTVSSLAGRADQPHDPHEHDGIPAVELPAREVLDSAGELLRALAAPVRIAIVLQLHASPRC